MPVSDLVRRLLARFLLATGRAAPDLGPSDWRIIRQAKPESQTSLDRLAALIAATRYISRQGIPGAIAECGVWRGGSMMAVALALLDEGDITRDLWLYDTFSGMPKPSENDRTYSGQAASEIARERGGAGTWNVAHIDVVRGNLARTGYPMDRVRFVQGLVEETVPAQAPDLLALLRLDTDYYYSTKHELVHLYPRLGQGGILIVDDYGHWAGARQAVEEYFDGQRVFLHRVDYTARLLVKP